MARDGSIKQPNASVGVMGMPRAVVAAGGAMLLGVFILFGVGFAGPSLIHGAAHDSRHSFAFPCH